jgi:hypothetical protein
MFQSINSLLNNSCPPNEAWIIDDGSEKQMKFTLLNFSIETSKAGIPIHFLSHGINKGIGHGFERVYNLIRQNDELDVACIIESDYLWRVGWLEDVLAVFEARPEVVCIAGTDHPDMYDRHKTHTTFPELMKEQFGKDLEAREHLYKPFEIETIEGKIKIQGVSNSCGCQIIHWKRLKQIITHLENASLIPTGDYWKRMDRAFNKGITHDTRANASDAHMSGTISMYSEMYLKDTGVDITKNFGFVSICDYSISQHICGGGVNGRIVPEGATFIHSPTWNDEFLKENPRKLCTKQ